MVRINPFKKDKNNKKKQAQVEQQLNQTQTAQVPLQPQGVPQRPRNDPVLTEDQVKMVRRVVDSRFDEYGARGGVVGGVSYEEKKNIRELVVEPGDVKLKELTYLTERQAELEPFLWTMTEVARPGRKPGSLLPSLLLYQSQCRRSKKGYLLSNLLNIARVQTEEEAYQQSLQRPL